MKKMILGLAIVMACSMGWAQPEKDGPFPRVAAGVWTSDSGKGFVSIQVHRGRTVYNLYVMMTDSRGHVIAAGATTVSPESTVANVPVRFWRDGHAGNVQLSLVGHEGGTQPHWHLRVLMLEEANKPSLELVYSRP